jgi:hypothetical protein
MDRLQITNAEEVLRKCQDWMPPGSQRPARCEGTAFANGGMPADVAALRRADILVRQLYGSSSVEVVAPRAVGLHSGSLPALQAHAL